MPCGVWSRLVYRDRTLLKKFIIVLILSLFILLFRSMKIESIFTGFLLIAFNKSYNLLSVYIFMFLSSTI